LFGVIGKFAFVVSKTTQDQKAEEPSAGTLLIGRVVLYPFFFFRHQSNAEWLGSRTFWDAPDFGQYFHDVMMCNRYVMA